MSDVFEVFEGSRYRRKVRAIIVNERGEFLLIQPVTYKEGRWTFVGGGIEEGEDSKRAMTREISEEIGAQRLFALKHSSHQHRYKFSNKYRQKHRLDHDGQVADLFWVEIMSDAPIHIQKSEVKQYKWATLQEIKKLIAVPAQLEVFDLMLLEFSSRYHEKNAS